MSMRDYEAIIGLEVHVELKTGRKIFCTCPAEFGAEPNTNVCTVCLGMPGTLPVLDSLAVEYAVRAGVALNCKINKISAFDRKNYFYPDLPKGYQITQYFTPICTHGEVPIEADGIKRSIGLERIHIEEDAGRLIHRGEITEIDYNRCGVPLIEIVSLPEIRTPAEAKAYLTSLRRILLFAGVSDCKMNEGSLRCDVNISLRRRGCDGYGVKCEIKNVNSINYVGRAIEYEIARQAEILDRGEIVPAETRRYNEDSGRTDRMRAKEAVVDYRYFAEPNLPPLVLSDDYINEVKRRLPKMPDEICNELICEYGIKPETARLITEDPETAEYFMRCAAVTEYKSVCANLFVGEVMSRLSENGKQYIKPEYLAEVCSLLACGRVVSGSAKELIHLSYMRDKSPLELAETENMLKMTDESTIGKVVDEVISENEKAISDIKRGKINAKKQLIGGVMRKTGGLADPEVVQKIIDDRLSMIN